MWRIQLLIILSAALAAADSAKNPPTSEETTILLRLNQHRADFVDGDRRITEAVRLKEVPVESQPWTFNRMPAGKSQPLVFNPQLMAVAHALLAQHITPQETHRFDASANLKAAGYTPETPNLAMFAYDAASLSIAYETALTNSINEVPWFGTTKRPVLINSEAMKSDYREAGVAVTSEKGKFSLVIVLGSGVAKRYVGGIAYLDANHDDRYGLTEGKAGVVVRSGTASMTSGPSGAWWLPLDTTDAVDITITSGDQSLTRTLLKSPDNQQIIWRIPPKADLKDADRLISDAERSVAGSDEDRKRTALVKLIVGTRMKILDEPRQKHIATLVDPLQAEFQETVHQIESSLSEDSEEVMKRFAEQKKLWKNAIPAWFKSAQAMAEVHQQLFEYLSAPADRQESLKPALMDALKAGMAQPGDPSFLEQYINWVSQVDRTLSEVIGAKNPE